jgi:hypothetical protein
VKPLWEVWRFLKKLKLDQPHDIAMPDLGIYTKEYNPLYDRATCTFMFTEALLIIVKV